MSPLELQRIADGEVTHAQRAELLSKLEPCCEQWRTLALLLLEDKQWANQIAGREFELGFTPHGSVGIVPRVSSKNRWLPAFMKLATAACLTLSLGLAIGSWYSNRSGARLGVSQPASLAESPLSPSMDYQSPWRVRVESPSSTPFEIPLVDAREIDPQLILASNDLEIAKLNQQLKRKGLQLDAQPRMYTGSLQDGRKIVVPIHNVSIKPYGL